MKRKARKSREDECVLCRRAHSDPDDYGQMYREDGLCAHEFCLYPAKGLFQRGTDGEGFYRFLPGDIRRVVKRAARKSCCVCRRKRATVVCQQKRCARKFHFPCGSERGCISQFFGEYRSFCWEHRPEQRVETHQDGDTTCIICMEPVEDRTSYSTMVCPVCKHAWFHRGCIQGQALRAGFSNFRCPQCKDGDRFLTELLRLGIRIPIRRLAWEQEEEEETFEELYETYSRCDASQCLYRGGREQAEEEGPWQLLLCSSCAASGTHRRCSAMGHTTGLWECDGCAGRSTASSAQSELVCPGTSQAALASSQGSPDAGGSSSVLSRRDRRAGHSRFLHRPLNPYSRP
ncbi:PHD finger protein 7-like [Struthio camelus]|uniref:PHD finger protein 7-like n=2 Tax=Struthio camelus TaxID=8801 RepID=UPI0036042856